MHRVIQETIAGLGGLDIIVNKCAAHFPSLSRKDTCSSQQHMAAVLCSGGVCPERLKTCTQGFGLYPAVHHVSPT